MDALQEQRLGHLTESKRIVQGHSKGPAHADGAAYPRHLATSEIACQRVRCVESEYSGLAASAPLGRSGGVSDSHRRQIVELWAKRLPAASGGMKC